MGATVTVQLPGLRSPQAGFEAPFALLAACHERVQRSLQLLERLVDHLGVQGRDGSARAAAHDVWRYFQIAAPAHHADEEIHILPRLDASGDSELMAAARQIRADHAALAHLWLELGPLLQCLADTQAVWDASMLANLRRLSEAFIAIHDRHVPLEDQLAFPAAQARADDAAQRAMGAEMAARRQA